jgi:hypothetical protein
VNDLMLAAVSGSEILDDLGHDELIRLSDPQSSPQVEPRLGDGNNEMECLTLKANILRNCIYEATQSLKIRLKQIGNSLSDGLGQCFIEFEKCKESSVPTDTNRLVSTFLGGGGGRVRGIDIDNDEDTDIVQQEEEGPLSGRYTISECNKNLSICIEGKRIIAEDLKKVVIEEYKRKTGKNPPPPNGNGKTIPGGACSCCKKAETFYTMCKASGLETEDEDTEVDTDGVPENITGSYSPNLISIPKGSRPPFYPVRL